MKFPNPLAIALLFSGLMAVPAEANLISNGSFETPGVPSSSLTCGSVFNNGCQGYYSPFQTNYPGDPSDDISGWLVTGKDAGVNALGTPYASVMQLGAAYTETDFGPTGGTLHFDAEDGTQSLDLTGEGNQGANGVKQSFTSTPGTKYSLSFYLGHQDTRADGYAGDSLVDLYIDGVLVATFDNSAFVSQDVAWEQFAYDFTATGTSTVLAFINATPVGNNYTGLDNVVLDAIAVPEPATLALFALGFGVLVLRRRKTAPHLTANVRMRRTRIKRTEPVV
ncbi:MAG TPA: PEP-CTERM sorting domain-containing protein [Micropepsaceae bacterium]|nr:PEP-CTERM sorting domain-containing protein [Micropepsaceae bacterium]